MERPGWAEKEKPPLGRGRGGRLRVKSETKDTSPSRSPGSISIPHSSASPASPLESVTQSFEDVHITPEALIATAKDEPTESMNPTGRGPRNREPRVGRVPPPERRDDYVVSRPADLETKKGKMGTPIPLLTNYFSLKKQTEWALYKHAVIFTPEQDRTGFKKKMLRDHAHSIGAYIFDGSTLYTTKIIADEDDLTFYSTGEIDKIKYTIRIQRYTKLLPGDRMYMQFYNTVVRKCLFGMGLEEMGRNFFDHKEAIQIPGRDLVLWPGYVTAMRLHEEEVLLCVEVTHKVLRTETCLQLMQNIKTQCRGNIKQAVKAELTAGIVITHYNRTTYRVSEILWDLNPTQKFNRKGQEVSFAQYYQEKWGMNIKDLRQPLLQAKPTKRDKKLERGEEPKDVILIPELCQMTGLTDDMRADFRLMKELAEHLHMKPEGRIHAVNGFMKRLLDVQELNDELSTWGVSFNKNMIKCNGRVLPRENIVFATTQRNPNPEKGTDKADWTMAFRTRQMILAEPLQHWIILVPERDASNVDNLVQTMVRVAKPLGFDISRPLEIVRMKETGAHIYKKMVEDTVKKYEKKIQMAFVILPNNKLECYSAVKHQLSCKIGLPSQCFVAKNLTNKGLMSIATKVVIQMNAKLGGQPWSIELPIKNAMMVGFDVHRSGAGKPGNAIGAMVATTSSNFASYFSVISYHSNREELSANMIIDITKCCNAYHRINGMLPERIIFYRDGVGDGQLGYVYEHEMEDLKKGLTGVYKTAGFEVPKLTYIIVTKKINTRIFDMSRRPDNPPPGTIVDDIVTLPERYDFFLVSAAARQGTVSPCNYNVLMDAQGLGPDKIQRMTFKMCHMYFNWSGTVAVPAPCQYAHKLAFLTGMALKGAPDQRLNNLLHFL